MFPAELKFAQRWNSLFARQVSTVYEFNAMCDFQYLPMERQADGSYRDLMDDLIPPDIPAAFSWWDRRPPSEVEKDPLFTIPFQFSR